MSLDTIRDEFVTRLQTITVGGNTLRASKWFQDAIAPPCAVVAEDDPFIDYDQTLEGGAGYNFKVIVYASRVAERAGQAVLDAVRDPAGGVRAALNGDWSNAYYAQVHTAGVVQVYTIGTIEYLGCEFQVEVIAA